MKLLKNNRKILNVSNYETQYVIIIKPNLKICKFNITNGNT